MATIEQVILFSLVGGLFSLIGGLLLLSTKSLARKLALYAVPFAAGALLAAVFLDLLPEGLHAAEAESVLTATIAGILAFFLAEYFLRWFHHHHDHDNTDRHRPVSLIIVGDTIHNALDGVVIASAFLVSVPTGIITTIAVAAHEVPQEIGDMGLLLSRGLSRAKVVVLSTLSSLATLLAAVLTFSLGSEDRLPLGLLLGLSAGFLLYIALSDIIPTIHEQAAKRRLSWQPALLILGVAVVGLAINLSHAYIGENHDDEYAPAVIDHHKDNQPHDY